jgi:hypothetical protein
MNCYWKNNDFDKSGAPLMYNLNTFCSNNNLILYIVKMSLYEDIYIYIRMYTIRLVFNRKRVHFTSGSYFGPCEKTFFPFFRRFKKSKAR